MAFTKTSDDISKEAKEYMRRKNIEKALSSFGKWASRDEDSVDIVNKLRYYKKL